MRLMLPWCYHDYGIVIDLTDSAFRNKPQRVDNMTTMAGEIEGLAAGTVLLGGDVMALEGIVEGEEEG